jgi:hypothetical protein
MLLLLSEKLWHPSCWLLGEAQTLWRMVKMVQMDASVTLERVPDLHPVVILNGDWNKGQEVSVLVAFLEFNHHYSTEMEREAGSGRRKCRFLNKQLIVLARVFNKNKRKCVLLQNLFSLLLSNLYYFCFIYIVSFEFELTSYGRYRYSLIRFPTFIHLFLHSLIRSFIHSFVHTLTNLFIQIIHSFFHTKTHLFIHSSYVNSFVPTHSFIH